MIKKSINICWFRRDLRWHDNAALHHALQSEFSVMPIFIFDTDILSHLPENDARVSLIYHRLQALNQMHQQAKIHVFYGKAIQIWQELLAKYTVAEVYFNHDYEPRAEQRDRQVRNLLEVNGVKVYSFKDQCIFEKSEVMKDNGEPYTVYTPYKNKWRAQLTKAHYKAYDCAVERGDFYTESNANYFTPTLVSMGFQSQAFDSPSVQLSHLVDYAEKRDFPAIAGTSKVSVSLRFGFLSIRELVAKGLNENAQKWVDELIWRDFYMMILWHYPHTVQQSFKPQYDLIRWRNNEQDFKKWCDGQTGFPLVDAGMRELNATGWMHNRVRMMVASFLCKHLLIDWRWGEAYFASKLLDFELASNVGGWQWVCGSGNDGAPYFRVFSPMLQHKKFDPDHIYVKKWVPEWQSLNYKPMVDHDMARKRCLEVYKEALSPS